MVIAIGTRKRVGHNSNKKASEDPRVRAGQFEFPFPSFGCIIVEDIYGARFNLCYDTWTRETHDDDDYGPAFVPCPYRTQ